MKSYYLPISYVCNHKCLCCPCSKEQKSDGIISFDILKSKIDELKKNKIFDITLSGGEPTVHPDFLKIIEYLLEMDFTIHLLTNSDRFSDDSFLNSFEMAIGDKINQIFITTTIHSYKKENYEKQTLVNNSFNRVIKGLTELNKKGFNLSIKQCITKNNYLELTEYLKFLFATFNSKIEIQFWGIDYCEVGLDDANKFYLDFKLLKEPLESALDYYLQHQSGQGLSINNIPLCCVDMYYWHLFALPNIESYVDKEDFNKLQNLNYGTFSKHCKSCYMKNACRGAYKTTFDIFGDDIVKEPQIVEDVFIREPIYHVITEANYNKLYWSNRLLFRISTKGLIIINKKNGKSVIVKLKESQLLCLLDFLEKGIEGSLLEQYLNTCVSNGTELYYSLIQNGVVV